MCCKLGHNVEDLLKLQRRQEDTANRSGDFEGENIGLHFALASKSFGIF